ncbi:hypothetical protein LWC33_24660 [Pseudonocardia sp. RS11V-5]|uniref:Rv1733c family protein n=1 Tax=Pseudonocardia terrae TaxID=2905831 RepID=UPI001E4EF203|nr:hypothetical protein [Pseudonocardia terrae]MCE3554635.1 hypothetical protein [Pseudonocardia terrae]
MRAGEHAHASPPGRRHPRPARRRSDRAADLARWVVCAMVLGLLAATALVGLGVHRSLADRAAVEARDRTPIAVVLTENVPVLPERGNRFPAGVRWTDRNGITHVGRTEVAGPKQAGDRVEAWVTADGQLVRAPLTGPETVFVTIASTAVVLMVGGFVVAVLAHAAFAGVARLRAAEWEREWSEVEPHWRSGR